MTAAPLRASDRPQPESPKRTRSAVLTIEYLGCLITVRCELVPGEAVRGSYEVVPLSKAAVTRFEDLGIGEICSDLKDAADLQHIFEWAKCEIDFLLEQPF